MEFNEQDAKMYGDAIGVDWNYVTPIDLVVGMNVELEHGSRDPQTNVTNDDPVLTTKIAYAHIKEFRDYYERLDRMEKEADAFYGKV